MPTVNIFETAKPQNGEFFKFAHVGDGIQGTYIDQRKGTDSFGNSQIIYVLQAPDGKVWNLGFRDSATIIHEKFIPIKYGQIVGVRYDEERDSTRNPGKKVKIIRVYADPKTVDTEWLKQQADLVAAGGAPVAAPVNDGFDDEEDETKTPPFKSQADESGHQPVKEVNPKNDGLVAIRQLAITKGLTNSSMTDLGADIEIERFTGLKLEEENLTKIIIALTGYKAE